MSKKYKIMSLVTTVVLLVAGIFLFTACDKEEETIINPIKPDVSVKAKLDNFFSRENYTLANQFSDSVYIINSKEELKALGCDDIKINFKKYCIIWGKVTAYHSGYTISNRTLHNEGNGNYRYEVLLHVGDAGYDAVYSIFFWDIFPKKDIKNLVFDLKIIQL